MKFRTYIVVAASVALLTVGCPALETVLAPTAQPTAVETPIFIIDPTAPPATPTTVTNPTPSVPPTLPVTGDRAFAENAVPRQLTNDPGADLDPAWDPRGGAIAFMTSKPGAPERPFDIGAVAPDGTDERVLATGPNRDIGIGGELSWVGETGLLMTNERISIHEYMTFDSAKAPFDRSASNGNDAAFTQSLVIPGGMGGDGLSVSRDGKTVMWMIRTSHNPASWVVTVRTADVVALNGQSANDFGNVVRTHSGATDGPDFNRGFSLAPDAAFFVISLKSGEGYDLFVHDGSTGQEIRRLTTTGASDGVHNLYPDVSPDGRWVAFSAQADAQARPDLYVVGVDGTGLKQITDTPDASEERPSWSPDGAELAYQAQVHTDAAPNWDIFAIAVFAPAATTIPPTDVSPTITPLAPGLPPDPGEPGKATLQGIDSDNDGVRDDVQIAIFQRYPDDAVKQAALDQNTRALQESIIAGSAADSEGIFQAASLVLRAVDCVYETMDDSSAEISFIEDAVVNTPERTDAYIRFNEALDGQFFGGGDSENPCQ